jgi:hypothetical protein
MVSPSRFQSLVAEVADRSGVEALVRALGFQPAGEEVPPSAWATWGLADAGVKRLTVLGRSGSLGALLIEVDGSPATEVVTRLAGAIRARNPVRLHLFVFLGSPGLVLATHGPEGDFRHLALEPGRARASDLEALDEMAARDGETGLALALRQARAMDQTRVTGLFFRDFRSSRERVAGALTGLSVEADRERAQLALLLLCRLTFLYFLQRRGTLCGDDRYLVRLFAQWDGRGRGSFFRCRLLPLFFEALNRRPEQRSPAARQLGDLPYLNGGLFEPHPLELAHPELDLPDGEVRVVLHGLLERYRFTSREAAGLGGTGYGIDPEVLGTVFEGLMAPDRRIGTGSFYTPAPVVRRVVREGLAEYLATTCPGVRPEAVLDDAASGLAPQDRARVRRSLERIRVLDPACGSGAFLLGALHHLEKALGVTADGAGPAARREIVRRSLHGVDLLDDAALLCSLRLWLALSEGDEEARPLPNLDRRIRQGDALVEPLDLSLTDPNGQGHGAGPLGDPELRSAVRAVGPASHRYLDSSPEDRAEARRDLAAAERSLARHWTRWTRALQQERLRHLRAAAADRDLFGGIPDHAHRARAALRDAERRDRDLAEVARQLDEKGALPFFSFGIHFAHTGGQFDFIVSNPPWIRAHRWPERLRRVAALQYEVCRDPGWPGVTRATGTMAGSGAQLDLSLLFLERCCRLLAPGGVLAILVPAKMMRALYGGSARRILLRDLEFGMIEDHALDQRSIFRADAFTAVLVLRRPRNGAVAGRGPTSPPDGTGSGSVRVRMVRRGVEPLEFRTRVADLPLVPGDPASPWIMAPPEVVAVLRTMQRVGGPLGSLPGLRVRRGVMTGANDVLVMSSAEPRLGGLSRVEAAGHASSRRRGADSRQAARYRAHVETEALRPLVRGADIDCFRFGVSAHLVWCHDHAGRPISPPRRMERYLQRHRERLERRPGWRQGLPLGTIFRLSADTLRPKVAWHDLSDRLRAVALPATVRFDGADRELVPLNTVYFLPTDARSDALLLAGILNSLPVSTFARAIAERAKDARFRFFAWTVAWLPLPPLWRSHPAAPEILALSRTGHERGGLDRRRQRRLDRAVASLYGLDGTGLEVLENFDAWLRGDG